MTNKVIQNRVAKLQLDVIALNMLTLEECKMDEMEDTLKVWRALNNAVECLEDARVLIYENNKKSV